MTAATAPGRAAYEAWNGGAENAKHSAIAWKHSGGDFCDRWEAAAQAAIEAVQVADDADMRTEIDQLREERDSLTGRVAELVTEGNELRAKLERYRQALERIAKDSEGYDPGTNEHAHHSAAVTALRGGTSPAAGDSRDHQEQET